MSKSTCAVIFGVIYSVTVLSTVSGQMGSPAWQANWPSSDQSKAPAFLPEWQADLASITFDANSSAPIVTKSQVGHANSGFCDWSYDLCNATTDIYQCNSPMQWGLTFDDGPVPPQSGMLYDFLAANNQTATHFMIGSNMVKSPDLVKKAFDQGGQIAVHTWTHRYMTTLSNSDAYAELRWSRDIIKNITGMTPLWWRPPYGDVDNRIRTIATHLGLITTTWNKDTDDWCIDDTSAGADGCGSFAPDSVHTNLEFWSVEQKTNPVGVVCLEHELSPGAVNQFIQAYPVMKSNGWNMQPVASCNNKPFYLEQSVTTSSLASVSLAPSTVASVNALTITKTVTTSQPLTTTGTASSSSASALSFTVGALSMVVVVVVSVLQF